MHGKRRFFWLGTTLLFTTAACTLILDRSNEQCSSNGDCATFGARALCVANVCTEPPPLDAGQDQNVPEASKPPADGPVADAPFEASVGPDAGSDAGDGGISGAPGCFSGTPATNDELLNACTPSACMPFDNCSHLGLCDGGLPGVIAPPAPPPPNPPANTTATVSCTTMAANAGKQPVYVTGSSNFPPFLATFAPVLAKDGYATVWQTSNSCAGVDSAYNQFRTTGVADPVKQQIKDQNGRTTLFFNPDGTSTQCLLDTPTAVDIGESDIYAKTCETNIGYDATLVANTSVGEYLGPILPMSFIVPSASTQDVFSAEAGQAVFGRGGAPLEAGAPLPYTDPTQLFIRASSTATNQIMSRGIFVDPTKWWGVDKGTAAAMSTQMLAVSPALAEKTIGIISADFADNNRGNIKTLAFQAKNQTCGFWPDSTKFATDKRSVRDGHYALWGPIHFFTKLNGSVPASAGAAAFVTRFSKSSLDQDLLESTAKSHVIPACAMNVTRDVEMGPLKPFNPPSHCGCFYDKVATTVVPASCKACASAAECTDPARQACNYGFCEVR